MRRLMTRVIVCLVGCVALALSLGGPAIGDTAPVPTTKVHDAYEQAGTAPGVYLDKTYYLPFRPEYLGLTSRTDATAPVSVDDEVEITVGSPEFDEPRTFRWDYSNGCSGIVSTQLGQDITRLLARDGGSTIRVKFINKCGGSAGSSGFFFEGARMTQTAGDRTDRYDDLRLPPGRTVQTEVNPLLAILGIPGVGYIDVAGPLLVDGRVVANARIETRNYLAGANFGAIQRLAEADCARCSFRPVETSLLGHLPADGVVTTEPISAPLAPGKYYRLEVQVMAGQLDRNYQQTRTEPGFQEGTYTSSPVLLGGLN